MRLKRSADILKGCFYKMPEDPMEIPVFFDYADRHFETNHIDEELKLSLINPYLSDKARRLVTRLSQQETDTYEKLKAAILVEFRLTPQKYKELFKNARKTSSESHVQYATRLRVLWDYYARSREVKGDYDKLCELIVADKFKEDLPANVREFIRGREGEHWEPVQHLARISDIYTNDLPTTRGREENRSDNFNRNRGERSKSANNEPRKDSEKDWRKEKPFQAKEESKSEREWRESKEGKDFKPKCWKCGQVGHVSRFCKKDNNDSRYYEGPTKKLYQVEVEGRVNDNGNESEN